MEKITSLQNQKVKFWVSLKNKKVREENKLFIIEGDHLLKEAKVKNIVKEVISIEGYDTDYLVTKEIMQKISGQQSISKKIGVCEFLPQKKIEGNTLVLDCLQDPGNLGTLIRSAVAFGFKNILLSNDSVDLYNEKVIRASEGMIFHVNVVRCNLLETLPKLKKDGYKIIGTTVKKEKSEKIKGDKLAIVIGNEGQGMSEDVKKLCDSLVNIPMASTCESLNAAIAGSILMYEVYRESC